VKVTGAARLYRAASGGPQGYHFLLGENRGDIIPKNICK